jgi:hypothetical protein
MSFRRQLSWSTSLHELRAAAPSVKGAVLAPRGLIRLRAADALHQASRRPLVVAGRYDRAAIMQLAIADAHDERARGSASSWQHLLRMTLKSAWKAAQRQRSLQLGA